MNNSKILFQEIVANIELEESAEEIESIVYILMEKVFGISRTEVMVDKMVDYPQEAAFELKRFVEKINHGEPVQYVIGEAYFFGRIFQVNPSVLIPRPETEELIRVVLTYESELSKNKRRIEPLQILDIGTGSGCIPITLFHEVGLAEIFATDVSNAALSVAGNNAELMEAKITFIEHNILKEKLPVLNLDVITSNPPYVTEKEKSQMKPNVLRHEPRQALFVPDDDPLVFHKMIVQEAKGALKEGGMLAVEINENFGKEVSQLFLRQGFNDVRIINDLAGKERIVKGMNRPA